MIDKHVSHYIIKEQLGRGGMGIVYRARDTKLDRDVALKFLPPELSADEDSKARFVQEAKAASALDHPNICTIHEIGESEEGKLFIAMSYYDGQTLKYLLDEGAMSETKAAGIALRIAEGLSKAHSAGITHRDIKPANIMVTADGRVKILDFGLAKLGQGIDLTKAGSTVGTTSYMSPEQSSGKEVDGRTDIWSLGVILYEMLSGGKAFGGGYDQAVLYSVLNEDPAPLEGIDEGLVGVVDRLLKKAPDERFQSAQDVLSALDPFASGISHVSLPSASETKSSIMKWAVPVGALLIVVVVWISLQGMGEASDDAASGGQDDLIAVLPFSIQGSPDMEYLSESMVTLLSTMFDGAGRIKTVDHAAVFEYVQRERGEGPIGPSIGSSLSEHFGAANFILGSISRAGSEYRMSARLYAADGTPALESTASYTGDEDFLQAVDVLAAGLIGGLLTDPDEDMSSIAASTTSSFDALKHYLTAEKLVRMGEYTEAYDEIQKTLALDSTFALAWYLRAETQGWIDIFGGSTRADLLMAEKYSDQLSGRAKRILEAELAFNDGRDDDAKQMYEAILRDYPSDIEATGQLAEVIVHYSTSESENRRARTLFDRVVELTPGSEQFSFHYSDLLAYEGFLTGDYYGLDSLAAVYAGMDIPERGAQLDWSKALDQMRSATARDMVIYALFRGSPEDSIASYNRTGAGFNTWRLKEYGHPDYALAVERFFNPGSYTARAADIIKSKGQFFSVDHLLLDSPQTESYIAASKILEGSLSTFDISADSLNKLEAAAEEWNLEAMPIYGFENDGELVRAYMLAQIAFRNVDQSAFDAQVNTFNSIEPDSVENPVWISVSRELEGLGHWLNGDILAAIVAMKEAQIDGIYFLNRGGRQRLLANRFQPVWYLARLLDENGQKVEAIEWYTSVLSHWTYEPAGWEMAAKTHEELGNTREAIRYYEMMIERWKDADPILQPRVEAAKARVEVLLDRLADEPR